MDRIDLPHGPIEYRTHGPADGPVVVFVHGFLVDHRLWGGVPEELATHGIRSIAVTLPLGAHRLPMHPDADLSPSGVARLLGDFLTALDLDDITLVGNDTGGAICQMLITSGAPAVERIGRLVLTNCDGLDVFPPFPFNVLFRLARHPKLAGALLGAVRWRPLRHSPLGFGLLTASKLDPALSRDWVRPYLTSPEIRHDVAAFARAWSPDDLREPGTRLDSFDRPVFLCWGLKDRLFTVGLGRRLAAAFPQSTFVEVPDSSTFVPIDQPAILAERLRAFVPAPDEVPRSS